MSLAKYFSDKKSIGMLTSLILHAFLLLLGGLVFAQPIQYAIQAGSGGVEVNLVAAPAELIDETLTTDLSKRHEEIIPQVEDPENISLPEDKLQKRITQESPVVSKKVNEAILRAASLFDKGDGTSSIPGKDQTTFSSSGGALTQAKPSYLKNPAPAYPMEARKKGWQGVVLLKVSVDQLGRAQAVEVEQSSGFKILDDSAIKTVSLWRFSPAKLGGLPISSTARVPIRFKLESANK